MELATLQRQLLGLIKFSYQVSEADDPYIRTIAQSSHLQMVREIVLWWRAYSVERYCFFTATLLKRLDCFDDAVLAFVSTHSLSPFIEKLGPAFLDAMSDHADPLVASLAQFEHALIKVKKGDLTRYVVAFDHEPYVLLNSLLTGDPFDRAGTAGRYQAIIAHDIPDLFEVLLIQG
jgi:hypothetical protein